MRRNRVIQSNHLRKHWQLRIKTHFDQPGRKAHRRNLRAKKATDSAPKPPTGPVKPVVRCPTFKHNTKVRFGRGFSLAEIKAAKIDCRYARSIGISVDLRRVNKSQEAKDLNVQRLKEYLSKVKIHKRPKEKSERAAFTEMLKTIPQYKGVILPIVKGCQPSMAKLSDYDSSESVYKTLRVARKQLKLAAPKAVSADADL